MDDGSIICMGVARIYAEKTPTLAKSTSMQNNLTTKAKIAIATVFSRTSEGEQKEKPSKAFPYYFDMT